jgi:lipopolysaccharide export system permease protein
MSTITRYVLRELIRVFLYALAGLTGVFLVAGVVQEAVREGLPPTQILRVMPYILPESLRFSVPVALLLGTTILYSRMAGYNEVVAIKALGISPTAILWPTFAVAFLLSLIAVWLNDVAVSWGRLGVRRVLLEGVEEIAYGMLRTEGSYSSNKFSINVKGVEGRRLIRPIVTLPPRGDMPGGEIEAQEAELESDPRENVLKVVMRKCLWKVGNWSGAFDVLDPEIPLSEASRVEERSNKPSCLALWRIPGEIVAQQEAVERNREELAAAAAFQMLTGDFNALAGPGWDQRMAYASDVRTRLCQLRTEPYRRWSAGFSCLFFVWMGAPMAIWLRNKDFLTSFFLCFSPILAIYYPLMAYGIDGAKNGTVPPISVWAGNVVLLVAGAWLLRRVFRY